MRRRLGRVAVLGFRPGSGGVGRVMVNLLSGMARRGVELDLLLPPGEYPDLAAVEIGCARFLLDSGRTDQAASALQAYLTARHPDAILSNKDQTNVLLAGMADGATPGRRPFIVFRVGTNVLEKLRRGSLLTYPWKRHRLAALYRRADALIGISTGGSEALRRLLGNSPRPQIHTIRNPVDLDAVRSLARAPTDHPWFASGQVPVIVSVGRLVAAKDYPTLLRAFRRVREALDCRLVIIGEGKQRARLRRLADKLGVGAELDLPGFVTNPFPYMGRADLFAVSSLFEGANNALMEALALGTACVSTDCPSGPREILDGGRYGRLVPVGDARALANAILDTLHNRPDPSSIRRGAERFALASSVESYLEVLAGDSPEARQ